jgi:hypothetical protein
MVIKLRAKGTMNSLSAQSRIKNFQRCRNVSTHYNKKQSTNTKNTNVFFNLSYYSHFITINPFHFHINSKINPLLHSFISLLQTTNNALFTSFHTLSLCNSNGVNTLSLHSSSFVFPFCPHCSIFNKPRFTTSSIF